jgi:hypothetical protein
MSIKIGDIRYPDKHSQFIVKRIQGNNLLVENTSVTSEEPGIETVIPKDYFLSLPTSPIRKVINTKPGFAGLINCGHTCFMNSIFQSIINCNPLREKIMKIKTEKKSSTKNSECKHEIMENFFRVIHMLITQTGSLDISFFMESIRPYFPRIDDPSVFLDFIYENLVNCGYLSKKSKEEELEGLKFDNSNSRVQRNDAIQSIIAVGIKSCLTIPAQNGNLLQNLIYDFAELIILPDKQEFIILHPDNGRPDGVATRLPPSGIININQHRFKVCSIIVRVGQGHYYTVTWNGRYDDDTVEESSQFMVNLLKNGYDTQTEPMERNNNGCFYFFEKIEEERHSGRAAEHSFGLSASSHSGMAAEHSFGSSVRGHSGMAVEPSFETGTEALLQMYIQDAQENFEKFQRKKSFLKKNLSESEGTNDVKKIRINLIKINRTYQELLEIMAKLEYINGEFQKLFEITQRPDRLIMIDREMDEIRIQIKEIERKLQVLGDEELARQFVGRQGGNVNYKNKYLLYKEKYLLLKKKMNN